MGVIRWSVCWYGAGHFDCVTECDFGRSEHRHLRPSAKYVGLCFAMVPGTSTASLDVGSGTNCATGSEPSALHVGPVLGTSTSLLGVASDAPSVSSFGLSTSYIGRRADKVPGILTSSLNVVSDAHSVTRLDPSASYVDSDVVTVPGTSTLSPGAVSDAQCVFAQPVKRSTLSSGLSTSHLRLFLRWLSAVERSVRRIQ